MSAPAAPPPPPPPHNNAFIGAHQLPAADRRPTDAEANLIRAEFGGLGFGSLSLSRQGISGQREINRLVGGDLAGQIARFTGMPVNPMARIPADVVRNNIYPHLAPHIPEGAAVVMGRVLQQAGIAPTQPQSPSRQAPQPRQAPQAPPRPTRRRRN